MSKMMVDLVAGIVEAAPSLNNALFLAVRGQSPAEWRLADRCDRFPAYLVAPPPPPLPVTDATTTSLAGTGAMASLSPISEPLSPDKWKGTPVPGFDEACALFRTGDDATTPVLAFALLVLGTPDGQRRAYLLCDTGTEDMVEVTILMAKVKFGVFRWEYGNFFARKTVIVSGLILDRVKPDGEFKYIPFEFGDLNGLLKTFGSLSG